MNLQEAAALLGVSKKTLWRAVKAERLAAKRIDLGGKWEYRVSPADLEAYRSTLERSTYPAVPVECPGGTFHQDKERDTCPAPVPPVELYLELVDRLTRAERRAVELELALRQSQRLLAENAESIAEREARAREAEAKADQLVATLEATRPPQKRSSWFSWLTVLKDG